MFQISVVVEPLSMHESAYELIKQDYECANKPPYHTSGLLSQTLDLPARRLDHILTIECFSRIIGMFEQNNVGGML